MMLLVDANNSSVINSKNKVSFEGFSEDVLLNDIPSALDDNSNFQYRLLLI